ncbi:MAG: YXWGXW repeat-containing protein [Myxococcales bacterium]|nr:YXWGXW repeat-containing protein [Myxococcales bacterium]
MNRTRRILSGLGLALVLGTTLPACVVAARGRLTTGAVVAYDQPPPPRVENPQPMAGHVWVHGNWTWQNNQWVWADGHWQRERAGYAWQDGRWEPRNGSWHWVGGDWVVSGSGTVVVGGGNDGGRPRDQDHRFDNQPQGGVIVTNNGAVNPQGGVIVTNNGPQGGVIVNGGQGGLVATNGAGTVISQGGHVIITGPTAPPPPPRVESPGPARRGYVWIEGAYFWDKDARAYNWAPGHWERAKANHRWVPVRWEQQGGVYIRVGGEWHIN